MKWLRFSSFTIHFLLLYCPIYGVPAISIYENIGSNADIATLEKELDALELKAGADEYQANINGKALTECREDLEKTEKNLSAYSEDLHVISLAVANSVVGDEIRSISSYSLQEGLAWRVEAHRDYVQIQRPGSATIVPLSR